VSEDLRPVDAFVHGIDGPCVVVPGRVAAWLLAHTDLPEQRMQQRAEPDIYPVLLALTKVGNLWRSRTSATSAATGSAVAPEPEVAPALVVMSTSQAAEVLGLTDRAIRLACTEGRLLATHTAGRWQISRADLDTYRANRAA
jgi:excisionase family DNA binding protein